MHTHNNVLHEWGQVVGSMISMKAKKRNAYIKFGVATVELLYRL